MVPKPLFPTQVCSRRFARFSKSIYNEFCLSIKTLRNTREARTGVVGFAKESRSFLVLYPANREKGAAAFVPPFVDVTNGILNLLQTLFEVKHIPLRLWDVHEDM